MSLISISSDTNIWIDFNVINYTELPFLLPYRYIMYRETIQTELLYPSGLRDRLVKLGLTETELEINEFQRAEKYRYEYNKLSMPDCIALAIAKERKITLLTGDKALRQAANHEKVNAVGTIKILDELYQQNLIQIAKYLHCLEQLSCYNGKLVRLPEDELKKRIIKCKAILLS